MLLRLGDAYRMALHSPGIPKVKYHLYCDSSKISYPLHSKYYILLLHETKCGDLTATLTIVVLVDEKMVDPCDVVVVKGLVAHVLSRSAIFHRLATAHKL